jgi:hypothetical protein
MTKNKEAIFMKRMIYGLLMTVFVLTVALGLGACAKKTPKPIEQVMGGEFKGAPDWVTKSCGTYYKTKGTPMICGVGSVGGSRNVSLMRTAAEARARAELARSLQVKVKAMLKDYQATTTGGQDFGTSAADEQHVVDVSKQITDMTLSGTELVDTWVSPNGTFYALVAMDVEKFKGAVSKMNNLSDSVRKAVEQRADKAFGELDEEIDKERTK